MTDNNVSRLNVKPDCLAHQLAMHEAMQDELRAVLAKYQGLDLIQPFISDAFAEVGSEANMGPMAFIEDGGEPA
jgi:hypothetical protein